MSKILSKDVAGTLPMHAEWMFSYLDRSASPLSPPPPPLGGYDFKDWDLRGADLRGADLRYAHLQDADLSGATLDGADLSNAKLDGANLTGAHLWGAKFNFARLDGACLHNVKALNADFEWASLVGADMSCGSFVSANLKCAMMMRVDLDCAILDSSRMEMANQSGARGIRSPLDCLQEWFQWAEEGIVAYKAFGLFYRTPPHWDLSEGSVIREMGNHQRHSEEGSGVHMSSYAGVGQKLRSVSRGALPNVPVWEVLVPLTSFLGVVVPYNSEGDIRVVDADVKLLRKLSEDEVRQMRSANGG